MRSPRPPLLVRYTRALVKRRRALLTAVAVVVTLAATGFLQLEFDTTYRIWFEEDSPRLAEYDQLLENFGSDDSALIVVTHDRSLFDNDVLAALQRLENRLWKIDGVKRVDSLANFSVVRANRVEHESAALVVTESFVAAAGDQADIHVFGHDGQRNRLLGHSGTVEHLALSEDQQTLYSTGLDRSVRSWRVDGVGQIEAGFVTRALTETPSAMLLHGQQVLVGTLGEVVLVDAKTGEVDARYPAGDNFVTALFVDDGVLMVVARDVRFLDLKSGRELKRRHHERPSLAAAFDRQSRTLFVAHDDGEVVAHHQTNSRRIYRAPSAVTAMAVSEQGLLLGLADGGVHTVGTDSVADPLDIASVHGDWVTDIVVDGERIITASRDRDVVVRQPSGDKRLTVHRAPVRRVALRAGQLITLGDDGDLYRFDADLKMLARLRRGLVPQVAEAIALSGDGRASLEVSNGFRTPVDVVVAGTSLGQVGPNAMARFDDLPVLPETACAEAECARGQYCDWERAEPTCTTVASVSLRDASGIELARAETYLVSGQTTRAEIPSDDAFSASQALASAPAANSRRADFVTAFPKTNTAVDALLPLPDGFVAPDVAADLRDRLQAEGSSRQAVDQASALAQARLSPFSLPLQPRRMAELQHLLTKKPGQVALQGMLNPGLDTTLFLVAVHQPSDVGALDRAKRVTFDLRDVVEEAREESGFGMHMTGGIVRVTTMGEYAEREAARLLPLFFAMLAVMLVVVYRRWAGLLVPLGLVVASIVFSMGLAGHLGASLNNVTIVGPQVVLAACIGDAVHVFNTYRDRLRLGDTVLMATEVAVTKNFMPCLWTSISTALGFFSLCTSGIAPVATFGWISGIGVLTAFVFSFTLMPGLLASLPPPQAFKGKTTFLKGLDSLVERLLGAVARGVNRRTGSILALAGACVVVACVGLAQLRIEASELGAFNKDAPIRVATELLEERNLSGSYGLQFMVDTGEVKGVRRVEHLQRIAKLQEHLASMPEVRSVGGIVDIHKQMNRVMHQDQPSQHRLPETDQDASSHYDAYTFSLKAGRDLTHRVSADERRTVVDVRLKGQKSTWLLAWGQDLRRWMSTNVPELDVTITGKSWLVTNTVTEIALGFVKNVGSAMLVISLLVLLTAGTLRVGVPGAIANILPIVTTLGFLCLTGDAMDVSAIVSCCVAMGIIVDDTLHFLARYKAAIAEGAGHEGAVTIAIQSAGKAILFTTAILVVGFMIFTLADYAVTVKIGLMASSMLLLGMVFDLTLLPALLRLAHARAEAKAPAVSGSSVENVV